MNRCVFAGPSLYGVVERPSNIDFRPPARMGDIIKAVRDGVEWIGLIDGYFGACASVWHKEILYALSSRVHVWGASSMGALRAAECQGFGMRPVGSIAWQYATGELVDDAAVALLHGPEEFDYIPYTEPLVDALATIGAMRSALTVNTDEGIGLEQTARSMHFSERSLERLIALAIPDGDRRKEVLGHYEDNRVYRKRSDALELIGEMARSAFPLPGVAAWQLVPSASLAKLVSAF